MEIVKVESYSLENGMIKLSAASVLEPFRRGEYFLPDSIFDVALKASMNLDPTFKGRTIAIFGDSKMAGFLNNEKSSKNTPACGFIDENMKVHPSSLPEIQKLVLKNKFVEVLAKPLAVR